MKVREVMTSPVETLDRNDTLSLAGDLMKMKRIRHLPVLEDGALVGIVSQRDLFRAGLSTVMGFGAKAQQEFMRTVLVKEVMTENVVTVSPEDEVAEAARLMLEKQIGCLPVVDDGKLAGLVSESDLVRLVART
ncbi:MAG: CBS domain-containing protein [Candidatus Tectomicrobia bacterium]|uniref:CBS domain-containing protein n=1 Tax=Tectimicrobiota bacterium TaxID=2528274 RepID=A0A932MPX0_UNCTE|nr:CBS domain-containing protein [Candidatus Tectomicrobia bacterium]